MENDRQAYCTWPPNEWQPEEGDLQEEGGWCGPRPPWRKPRHSQLHLLWPPLSVRTFLIWVNNAPNWHNMQNKNCMTCCPFYAVLLLPQFGHWGHGLFVESARECFGTMGQCLDSFKMPSFTIHVGCPLPPPFLQVLWVSWHETCPYKNHKHRKVPLKQH